MKKTEKIINISASITKKEYPDEYGGKIVPGLQTPLPECTYNQTMDDWGPYVMFPMYTEKMTEYEAALYFMLDEKFHRVSVSGEQATEYNAPVNELLTLMGSYKTVEEYTAALGLLLKALSSLRDKGCIENVTEVEQVQEGTVKIDSPFVKITKFDRYPGCKAGGTKYSVTAGRSIFRFYDRDFVIINSAAADYGICPYQAMAVWVYIGTHTGDSGTMIDVCENTGCTEEICEKCIALFQEKKNELCFKLSKGFGSMSYSLFEKNPPGEKPA